jgi:hypothetical protein
MVNIDIIKNLVKNKINELGLTDPDDHFLKIGVDYINACPYYYDPTTNMTNMYNYIYIRYIDKVITHLVFANSISGNVIYPIYYKINIISELRALYIKEILND